MTMCLIAIDFDYGVILSAVCNQVVLCLMDIFSISIHLPLTTLYFIVVRLMCHGIIMMVFYYCFHFRQCYYYQYYHCISTYSHNILLLYYSVILVY